MSDHSKALAPLFDQVLNKLQAGAVLLDDQLTVCFWNEWLAQHSGIDAEEILGKNLAEVLNLPENSYLIQRAKQAVELGLSSILSNTIHRHPLPLHSLDKKHELIEQKLILSRLKSGNDKYCLIHVYDVSDVLRREKSLKRQASKLHQTINDLTAAEQQIRSIFDLSPDGILILDENGQLQRLNAAAERMFEIYDYPELYNFTQLVSEVDDSKSFSGQFCNEINENAVENFRLTGASLTGRHFPLRISVLKTGSDESRSYSVICRDVTERQETEKRLKKLAHFDSLTGLANRATFNDRLVDSVKNSVRYDHKVALIYVDLDNLKPVNDHFGHRGGDMLLRAVANRLKLSIRDTDLVARIGGDEFTIILSETAEHALPDLRIISERLLNQIKEPLKIGAETVEPSASIGITISSSNDPDELVRHADIAMYKAKQDGKGRCVFYSKDLKKGPR